MKKLIKSEYVAWYAILFIVKQTNRNNKHWFPLIWHFLFPWHFSLDTKLWNRQTYSITTNLIMQILYGIIFKNKQIVNSKTFRIYDTVLVLWPLRSCVAGYLIGHCIVRHAVGDGTSRIDRIKSFQFVTSGFNRFCSKIFGEFQHITSWWFHFVRSY